MKWSRKALHLPDSPEYIDRINLLAQPLTVDLFDSRRPTSLCASCTSRLRDTPVRASFLKKLIDTLKPLETRPCDGTRGACANRGPDNCDICIAVGYTGDGFSGRLNRKVLHSEDIENVSPENKQEPDNTNLGQTSCRIATNQFAAASVVAGLTGRGAVAFASALHEQTRGQVAVGPCLKDKLTVINQTFMPFTDSTDLKTAASGTAVYIGDMRGFCQVLVDENAFCPADVDLIRASVDGSTGHTIKITVSFLSASTNSTDSRKRFLDSGVRQVYVLVFATGVDESYDVVKELLSLVDLRSLAEFFSSDIIWAQDTKMNWIFCGKTHGGSFPCPACNRPASDGFNSTEKLRTFGDIERDANKYQELVQGKSDSFARRHFKTFNNCVRRPLLQNISDVEILAKLTPNPLHMKLRSVNKLVSEMNRNSPEITNEFLMRIKVEKERYHGEFEGRACSKICREHETLRKVVKTSCVTSIQENATTKFQGVVKRRRLNPRRLEQQVEDLYNKHILRHYANAFEAQHGIMESMYGAKVKQPLREHISVYKTAISAVGCTVTQSMHMLIDHSEQFVQW